jgi:hypothetical protein
MEVLALQEGPAGPMHPPAPSHAPPPPQETFATFGDPVQVWVVASHAGCKQGLDGVGQSVSPRHSTHDPSPMQNRVASAIDVVVNPSAEQV